MLTHRIKPFRKRSSRSGTATIEFALCLPLMALICFGSIQASSTILLRHKAITVLEMGTLDYMLGNISESELPDHIESLLAEFELIEGSVTANQETIDEANYLRVVLTLPINDNITSPIFLGGSTELESQLLVYRP